MTDRNNPPPSDPAEYRDRELAARLNIDPVPGHDSSFWTTLESDLRTSHRAGASDTPLSNTPLSDTAVMGAVGPDAGLISLDQERASRRQPRVLQAVLAAAAVLVVAAIGAAAWYANPNANPAESPDDGSIVADEGPSDGQTTVPDTSEADPESTESSAEADDPPEEAPAPTLFPTIDYSSPTRVDLVGTGVAVGTTPDGKAILVVDDDRAGGTGCEGAPYLMLYAQDIATGERRAVLPDGMNVETGGLEFLFVDYDRPLRGEETKVTWTEYCDGERTDTYAATMAPGGTISRPVSITKGSNEDLFTPGTTAAAVARGEVSTNRAYVVSRPENTVVVESLTAGSEQAWSSPGTTADGRAAQFAPAADVVVYDNGRATTLWRFRTDETWTIPSDESTRYAFGRSGEYLFLNGYDSQPVFGVVNFGGGPDPQREVVRCSGAIDLAPLSVDDLPVEVADLVTAIDQAATKCDWEQLATLAGPDFTASFGGGEPAVLWPEAEARGEHPMSTLRILFRQPVAVDDDTGTEERHFLWPAVFKKDCSALDDADRQSLADLGYDSDQMAADCQAFGGYAGFRTGITGTGRWLFLVAGD